jgi:thermitase
MKTPLGYLFSSQVLLSLILVFIWPVSSMQHGLVPDLNRHAPATLHPRPGMDFAPDRVLVKLREAAKLHTQIDGYPKTGLPDLDQAFVRNHVNQADRLPRNLDLARQPDLAQIYILHLQPGTDVQKTVHDLSTDENIEWVEPDYLAYPISTTPNDPKFPGQWGLDKIEAPSAWDTTTGSVATPIAIIDSGIDFSHPDLSGKIWVNPGEIPGNSIDDDNDGYVDDVNGWNFVDNNNDPSDDNGHGTQVAGVAAAATNNGLGIAGVCWSCKIMPVKVMQAGGVANYSDIAAGVLYAAQKGARVINISLGGYSASATLQTAIQAAVNTYGAVVVAGAGNDNISSAFYPAAYGTVLAVAGTDQTDVKTSISNYGDWVDVSAPAGGITTTFMGGGYGTVDGTSFASAFVSGVAGLLRSQNAAWSADMVRAQIMQTADSIDALNPGYAGKLGWGRVNAAQAVNVTAHPALSLQKITVNGQVDGHPPANSSVDLQVALDNAWTDAGNVQGVLSTADAAVTLVQNSASYGDIAALAQGTNTIPFRFDIGTLPVGSHDIAFNLHVTASGGYSVNVPLVITTAGEVTVSGTISANTTWHASTTYIVTGNTLVPAGVTLTIQPGTTVMLEDGKYLQVQGQILANGTLERKITFTSNDQPPPSGNGWAGIHFSNAGRGTFTYCWFEYSYGGVLQVGPGAAVKVEHSFFNRTNEGLISISSTVPSNFRYNRIWGTTTGGALNPIILDGAVDFSHNLIYDNTQNNESRSASLFQLSNSGAVGATISDNTVFSNQLSGIEAAGQTGFHGNNLFDNSPYDARATMVDADLTGNYWGQATTAEMNVGGPDANIQAIFDNHDDFNYGKIDYSGWLTAPVSTAPAIVKDIIVSPDTTIGIQTATFDVKFTGAMDPDFTPNILFQSANQDAWTTYNSANSGFSGDNVSNVASAKDGSIWISAVLTDGAGAQRFDGEHWTSYTTANSGLPSNDIGAITSLPDGAVWFGTSGGAARFDGTHWISYTAQTSGLPGGAVIAEAGAADGSVWFGTDQNGAARFDGANWTVYNTTNSGLPSNFVSRIVNASDGSLWFGTDNGVGRFDGTSWTVFNTVNSGLPNNYVSSIASMPGGVIWFGTLSGAARFDGTNWKVFSTSNSGMPDDAIQDIVIAQDGSLWFGTRNGAARYDGSDWTVYNPGNSGLPNANVREIAISQDGSFWFATFGGGVAALWNFPKYTPDAGSGQWLDSSTYRVTFNVTSQVRRDNYLVNLSGAVGADGLEVPSVLGYPFTVNYAGAISDTTPPPAPSVTACAGNDLSTLSATWSARDPESKITLYSYAIGTTPGSADVVNWTDVTTTSFSRNNLNLNQGQVYYIAVKGRNEGGLWSVAGIPDGIVPGSGVCHISMTQVFLPLSIR